MMNNLRQLWIILDLNFNYIETPQIIRLTSGITLEFDDNNFGSIILPNFFKKVKRIFIAQSCKYELTAFLVVDK